MARKSRNKKGLRRKQRVRSKTLSRSRLLSAPFYFEDRRFVDERNRRKKPYRPVKTKILLAAAASKGESDKGSPRGRSKHKADKYGDSVYQRKLRICDGRKERREVLFSLKRAGRGRRVSSRRRISVESKVRC